MRCESDAMMGATQRAVRRVRTRRLFRINQKLRHSVRGLGIDETAGALDFSSPEDALPAFTDSSSILSVGAVPVSDLNSSSSDILDVGVLPSSEIDSLANLTSGSTAQISQAIAQGGADVASLINSLLGPSSSASKPAASSSTSLLSGNTGKYLLFGGLAVVGILILSRGRRR